jgi:hypothetical protein
MPTESKYILQPSPGTRCPMCNSEVELLCDKYGSTRKPWFYICFVCKFAAQVGKGPVRRRYGK